MFPTTFEKKIKKDAKIFGQSNFFSYLCITKEKTIIIKTMISVGQIIALVICVAALVALPKVITHFGQKNYKKEAL